MAGFEDVVRLDGALYCHGSPRSDDEIITAVTPGDRLVPMVAAVPEALIVCGHTHHQFELRAGDKRVVNAGSVGMPYEGRDGAFWLLVANGKPEQQRTKYDLHAAEAALRASHFPDVDDLIRESLLEPVEPAFVARHFEDRAVPDSGPSLPSDRPDSGMFVCGHSAGELPAPRGTRRGPRPCP